MNAFGPTLSTLLAILGTMAVVASIEAAVPLHPRGPAYRAHTGPNLALTLTTFATSVLLNTVLVATLAWQRSRGLAPVSAAGMSPLLEGAVTVLVLDFSFYVAHVAMHKVPAWWRYHRVHHSDSAVDVTTTIRQHPGETVIRYGFMGAFAVGLGANPAAVAVYQAWSALNGLLEHANIRVPDWLDEGLSLVTTWPGMHKVHHSRAEAETDTNYGNIVSLWDRLFGTFTPASRGRNISYGLDGFDDPASQTTGGLMAMPYRDVAVAAPMHSQ